MERVGHTWLPMGRPSGVAESFEALAARIPAAPEEMIAFFMNSRLDMGVINICCAGRSAQPRRWIAVQSNLALDFPAGTIFATKRSWPSEFLVKLTEMSSRDNASMTFIAVHFLSSN